ncbi:hypothetical protein PPERSA_01335 [Pseudocohnilembus persalinus]|uniref:Uncharacterized protein n=1 Tax=Pseudocohnilembus persalinus TaxID=266149 RepID=A0A0V0QH12_PSEPJ|nr:hypothetical protein PPERSA_01335 [Pseudocohnilembus persalinus]|eukprot:KRX01432.1 hypothetical protein PPERSA_01335 [Pseudocohnilembus persalinus]
MILTEYYLLVQVENKMEMGIIIQQNQDTQQNQQKEDKNQNQGGNQDSDDIYGSENQCQYNDIESSVSSTFSAFNPREDMQYFFQKEFQNKQDSNNQDGQKLKEDNKQLLYGKESDNLLSIKQNQQQMDNNTDKFDNSQQKQQEEQGNDEFYESNKENNFQYSNTFDNQQLRQHILGLKQDLMDGKKLQYQQFSSSKNSSSNISINNDISQLGILQLQQNQQQQQNI